MVTHLISFFIIWWLVFMILIPCWVKTEEQPEKGHADSAPDHPKIRKKAILSTFITVVLYAVICYFIEITGFSLRNYFTN